MATATRLDMAAERLDGVGGPIGSTGAGTAGQVLYWQDAVSATSEAALAYDAATNILTTGGLSTGAATATSVTDSGLTSGRVVLASTGGLLADDAGLTYSGTTDTLTATRGELEAMNVTLTSVAATTVSSVTPVLAKVGTITTVAGASLVDGDYFTINDGSAYVFEFDLSPGDGVTPGRTAILFTAGDSADTVRDNVILAINSTAIQITASSGGAATVALESDTAGLPLGSNSENVANAGWAVTGMSDPTAATAYEYKVVANFPNGGSTVASSAGSTAAGYATLGAKNLNRIVWTAVTGASTYTVYRTVGGATQGIIATVTAPAVTVDDTGLAGGGETAPTLTSTGKVTAAALTIPTGAVNNYVLTSDASGNASWAAGGGISGLTTNYLTKAASATTVQNTSISEASAGALATTAGTALGLTATAPAATTGASQAGIPVTITASPAVASTDTDGAAAGGNVTITAGAAARRTSGNANGGDINLVPGAGIGTGGVGKVVASTGQLTVKAGATGAAVVPSIAGSGTTTTGLSFNTTYVNYVYGGAETARFYQASYFGVGSGVSLGWANATNDISTLDTIFRRRAAANPAWGAAAASPVAYTHSLAADSRSGTDTDVSGAAAYLAPGAGTGAATISTLNLGGPIKGSTGTAAQTLAYPLAVQGETSADGTAAVRVTTTLPASPSATVVGVNASVTSAGSAAQQQVAGQFLLNAGYTGAKLTIGLVGSNAAAGTGNSLSTVAYNAGGYLAATGTTAGLNIGSAGVAASSTSAGNIGVLGRVANDHTTAPSIGVLGVATNITSPYRVAGGVFSLGASTVPTISGSVALLADNAAVAGQIIVGRDNGTTVFSVNDGGGVNAMYEVEANTAGVGSPNVLTATESRSVMTNEGATALNYHTLPTAAKGLSYTFYCADGDGIRVVAGAGDDIRIAGTVSAAAGYCESTSIGSSVTLLAINADSWVAIASVGSWTVV